MTARDCSRHETVPVPPMATGTDFADYVDSRWPFKATAFGDQAENNIGRIALFYSEDLGARDVVDGRRLPSAPAHLSRSCQPCQLSIEDGEARVALPIAKHDGAKATSRLSSPFRRRGRDIRGVNTESADPRGVRYKSSTTFLRHRRWSVIYLSGRPSIAILYSW